MATIAELDLCYQQIISKLNELVPDGVRDVDLALMQELGLLSEDFEARPNTSLTKFFHVVEAKEKITMYNDNFVVWVVPSTFEDESITLVLVALNKQPYPQLELAFSTSGVYNSSRIILRILEKFLAEIQETEETIALLKTRITP